MARLDTSAATAAVAPEISSERRLGISAQQALQQDATIGPTGGRVAGPLRMGH